MRQLVVQRVSCCSSSVRVPPARRSQTSMARALHHTSCFPSTIGA